MYVRKYREMTEYKEGPWSFGVNPLEEDRRETSSDYRRGLGGVIGLTLPVRTVKRLRPQVRYYYPVWGEGIGSSESDIGDEGLFHSGWHGSLHLDA